MNFDELIFLDGAMGTMLQARGMKPGDNPCVFGAEIRRYSKIFTEDILRRVRR